MSQTFDRDQIASLLRQCLKDFCWLHLQHNLVKMLKPNQNLFQKNGDGRRTKETEKAKSEKCKEGPQKRKV